jgi:hypothetical protein
MTVSFSCESHTVSDQNRELLSLPAIVNFFTIIAIAEKANSAVQNTATVG